MFMKYLVLFILLNLNSVILAQDMQDNIWLLGIDLIDQLIILEEA